MNSRSLLAAAAFAAVSSAAHAVTISRDEFDRQYATFGAQIAQLRDQYNASVTSCRAMKNYNQAKSCEDNKYAAYNAQNQSVSARQNAFYNAWDCGGASCTSKGDNPPMPEKAAAPAAASAKSPSKQTAAAATSECVPAGTFGTSPWFTANGFVLASTGAHGPTEWTRASRKDGYEMTLTSDGRWQVCGNGKLLATEYAVYERYDQAPGTKNIFEAHHPMQSAWAKANYKKYAPKAAPVILLFTGKKKKLSVGDELVFTSDHQNTSDRQNARNHNLAELGAQLGGSGMVKPNSPLLANAGQNQRAASLSRTYDQERELAVQDMQEMLVPAGVIGDLMTKVDAYYSTIR